MRNPAFVAAGLIGLCLTTPAVSQAVVPLPPFQAVSLEGGGRVLLRHGNQQKVTIVKGDPNVTRFSVSRKSLRIEACEDRCPSSYQLVVEIVAPNIGAIAVDGGGTIEAQSGFPARSSIALSVDGGGVIDTQAIDTGRVAASVDGGGTIRTRANSSLAASIKGGGLITYRGEPSVATSVSGGGSVRRAEGR